jgi:uncharacterized protein with GYD domain
LPARSAEGRIDAGRSGSTFVILARWTSRGKRHLSRALHRTEATDVLFEHLGAEVMALYWTQGSYDLVATVRAPDEETVAAGILAMTSTGDVQVEAMRAFDRSEIRVVVQRLGVDDRS